MNTFIRSQPDIVLVAFSHRGHDKIVRRNELGINPICLNAKLVESLTIHIYQHVARTCDCYGIVRLKIFVTRDSFKRINNFVNSALNSKHAPVIHADPHILLIVNGHINHSIVKERNTAGSSCLVIIEMIAVKTRDTVPC